MKSPASVSVKVSFKDEHLNLLKEVDENLKKYFKMNSKKNTASNKKLKK